MNNIILLYVCAIFLQRQKRITAMLKECFETGNRRECVKNKIAKTRVSQISKASYMQLRIFRLKKKKKFLKNNVFFF